MLSKPAFLRKAFGRTLALLQFQKFLSVPDLTEPFSNYKRPPSAASCVTALAILKMRLQKDERYKAGIVLFSYPFSMSKRQKIKNKR